MASSLADFFLKVVDVVKKSLFALNFNRYLHFLHELDSTTTLCFEMDPNFFVLFQIIQKVKRIENKIFFLYFMSIPIKAL